MAAPVVYRILARHGRRQVAPATRHPKGDPPVQEEWKKLPDALNALLSAGDVKVRQVRLIFYTRLI